jgi:hypothetical protein
MQVQIQFALTPGDIYRYHLFGYRRRLPSFQLRAFYIVLSFIAVLLFLNVPISPLHTLFSPTFRLFAAILFAVGLVLNVVLYKPLLLLYGYMDTRLNGAQALMMTPSGIWYRTTQSKEQSVPWQNVQAIEQDAHNLYFFLSIRGPLARMYGARDYLLLSKVCLIPKRAFANPLDAGTFFDAATSLWGNARSSPGIGGNAA